MSTVVPAKPALTTDGAAAARPARGRGDTFAMGVAMLLGMTVVQRVVGMGRSVLICRWLPASEVGMWELSLSFLMLSAPLVVLGLPGSFGRYVGYFQQRNRLRPFLKWSTAVTVALAHSGAAAVYFGRDQLARWVFNSPEQAWLLVLLAPCLLSVIAFNYSQSLLTALRLHRRQALVQFGHSLLFALLCVLLLPLCRSGAAGVIGAYGGACLAAAVAALLWTRSAVGRESADATETADESRWRMVIAFAMWTWLGTTVANLFAVADRYMIAHYNGLVGDALYDALGQYHCARMMPRLLRQVGYAVAAMLLPHLTQAWERGDRREADALLGLTLKLFAAACTAGTAVAVIASPLLFDMLLKGEYPLAGGLLPGMFVACIWFGMAILVQARLLCAEKAWLATIAFAVGLTVNVALNWVLLPTWNLQGAVYATAAGNLATLLTSYAFSSWLGLPPLRKVVFWSMLPVLLFLGPLIALAGVVIGIIVSWRSCWLLTVDEREKVRVGIGGLVS